MEGSRATPANDHGCPRHSSAGRRQNPSHALHRVRPSACARVLLVQAWRHLVKNVPALDLSRARGGGDAAPRFHGPCGPSHADLAFTRCVMIALLAVLARQASLNEVGSEARTTRSAHLALDRLSAVLALQRAAYRGPERVGGQLRERQGDSCSGYFDAPRNLEAVERERNCHDGHTKPKGLVHDARAAVTDNARCMRENRAVGAQLAFGGDASFRSDALAR